LLGMISICFGLPISRGRCAKKARFRKDEAKQWIICCVKWSSNGYFLWINQTHGYLCAS
jgi:hypothetical protein